MKRILPRIAFIALLVLVCSSASFAQGTNCDNTFSSGGISVAQCCYATTSGGSSQSSLGCTLSSNVALGNMLYVFGGTFAGGITVTASGSGGCNGTWTNPDTNVAIIHATSPVASAASCTVTLTLGSGPHNIAFGVVEIVGTNQTTDGHVASDAGLVTTGNPIQPASITTTANGDVIMEGVYLYANGSSPAYTAGTGTRLLTGLGNTDIVGIQIQVQTTAGAIQPNMTSSKTGSYGANAMAIKKGSPVGGHGFPLVIGGK